jgi:putative aldouronate transport system substrate-binding protein
VSRRRLLGTGLGLGAGVFAGGALAACGGSDSGGGGSKSAKKLRLPSYSEPRSVPGVTISKVEGVGPAYDYYPNPPYKSVANPPITSGKPVTTFQILYPAPPPALGDNPWWQQLNQRLGAEFKPTLVPYQAYAEKLQTTVASGDIPDITFIEPGQGAQSIIRTLQEGAFAGLTDILAGDGVKKYPNLAQIPTYAWKNCALEGTIYGVPKPIALLISDAGCSYRQDWATKLGYPQPPKNADELFELYQAFAKGDPNGNGKGDTWAIGALYQRWYYMMYGVPNNWRLGSDGKLTYYCEADEIADALAYMNKLWKAGAFHPDAPTQAWTAKAEELFLTDKVGAVGGGLNAHFGTGNNAAGNFRRAHKGVELTHLLSPGHDGGKASIYQQAGYFGIFAIPAKVGKDAKRTDELLRVLDFFAAPFGSEEFLFLNFGIKDRHYTLDSDGNPIQATGNVLEEMDLNYMNEPTEAVFFYPGIKGESVTGQKYVEQAAAEWIPDPTQGLVSDTFNRKFAAIKQINDDYEIGLVTGRRPLSDLKNWREDFKKSGGEDMRKEFEESLQRAEK